MQIEHLLSAWQQLGVHHHSWLALTHAIRNEVRESGAKRGRKSRETGKDGRNVFF
jgi:hypothetical protein